MCCRPQLIAKMISTVIVLTFVAFASASPLAERQSPPCSTTPPTLPEKCTTAYTKFVRESQMIFGNISSFPNFSNSETINQIERVLEPFLDTFCGSDCLGSITEALRCANQTETLNIFARLYCVRSGGRYCPIKLLEALFGNSVGPLALFTCLGSGTCSSSCTENLSTLRDRAGCCAASYFTLPGSGLNAFGRVFATCNVTLGNGCPVSAGWSGSAPQLSVVILLATAVLVTLML